MEYVVQPELLDSNPRAVEDYLLVKNSLEVRVLINLLISAQTSLLLLRLPICSVRRWLQWTGTLRALVCASRISLRLPATYKPVSPP